MTALSGWPGLRCRGKLLAMMKMPDPYRGFRFPAEIGALHGYANPLILLNFFKRYIFPKSLI